MDDFTRSEALQRIDDLMQTSGQHLITTPNPEIVVAAQHDPEFRKILNQAALALADGVGLKFVSWLLHQPLKERIAGSDFIWDIAKLAAEKGYTLYLLGGEEGVAERAAVKLKMQNAKLKIVGAESGSSPLKLSFDTKLTFVQSIRTAVPDILFVALGHGKQEKWIAQHLKELPSVKIAMGVGGALDFIAGHVRRAPRLLRLLGLEWLWRLLRQPWRLPRIWRAVVIFPLKVWREKIFPVTK